MSVPQLFQIEAARGVMRPSVQNGNLYRAAVLQRWSIRRSRGAQPTPDRRSSRRVDWSVMPLEEQLRLHEEGYRNHPIAEDEFAWAPEDEMLE